MRCTRFCRCLRRPPAERARKLDPSFAIALQRRRCPRPAAAIASRLQFWMFTCLLENGLSRKRASAEIKISSASEESRRREMMSKLSHSMDLAEYSLAGLMLLSLIGFVWSFFFYKG